MDASHVEIHRLPRFNSTVFGSAIVASLIDVGKMIECRMVKGKWRMADGMGRGVVGFVALGKKKKWKYTKKRGY